jgi:tetratricopeptide (TPR) repeat protein
MGGRQERSGLWVVVVTAFLLPLSGWAQQDMPPGQQALFDASDRAKTVPLDQGVKLYEQVIAQFPDTAYAGQALLNIGSLYLQNKLPEEALANAEQALEEYGDTYLAGQAIRRKFVTLAHALNQPQEALDFLDQVLDQYLARFGATDRMWLPIHRYDAYRKLGDRESALGALTEAIVEYPQVLDSWEFQRRYVPALRDAGKRAEALSAAKGAYACCRFADEEIRRNADLVVTTFTAVGDVVKANGFVAAQENPEVANPLADTAWPEITDEDKQVMLGNTRGDVHLQVCALLYLGQYDEALSLATMRLAEAKEAAAIAACVDSVARCFKAKDLNLVRANGLMTYVQQGEGGKPLLDF